jgi:hypothetical protein
MENATRKEIADEVAHDVLMVACGMGISFVLRVVFGI